MLSVRKKILFTIIAILAPLIIANEIIRLSWLKNFPDHKILVTDFDLLYSLKPDFKAYLPVGFMNPSVWKGKKAFWKVTINKEGIRREGEVLPKAKNGFRIICFGDSVTFGKDVDDQYTYPSQLEEILKERLGNKLEIDVINAGVIGYSSRQALVSLYNKFIKYEPDLIILEFGLNDARSTFDLFYLKDKKLMKGDVKNGFKRIYQSPYLLVPVFIIKQPLVSFIRYYGALLLYARLAGAIEGLKKSGEKKPINSIKDKSPTYKHSRVPPDNFYENLRQFELLSKEKGFKLVFYLPYGIPQTYKNLMVSFAYENKIPIVDFSRNLADYKLDEIMKVPVYSKLSEFYIKKLGEELLREKPVYLMTTDGGHPNALGNRIVAEHISKLIIDYKLFLTNQNLPYVRSE